MRIARALAAPAALATVALVVLLALRPLSTSRTLAIWLVLLVAIVLVTLVRRVPGANRPSRTQRFEALLRARPATEPPPVELLRMDRELELGIAGAMHAQRRLLPLLRTAAAARLGSRHGIDLERQPSAASSLLGDEVWELLRPDVPESADRFAPGVPRERLVAVIERLESL